MWIYDKAHCTTKKLAGWCRRDCHWKGQLSPRIFRLLEPVLLCSVLFTLGFGRNILADVAITLPSSAPLPSLVPSRTSRTLEASEGSKNLALKKADSDWSAVYDPHRASHAIRGARRTRDGRGRRCSEPVMEENGEREKEKWEMRSLGVE